MYRHFPTLLRLIGANVPSSASCSLGEFNKRIQGRITGRERGRGIGVTSHIGEVLSGTQWERDRMFICTIEEVMYLRDLERELTV